MMSTIFGIITPLKARYNNTYTKVGDLSYEDHPPLYMYNINEIRTYHQSPT